MRGASEKALVALAYASMCAIWGSTWMMIKIGLRGAPPLTGVGIRFVVAGLLVTALVALRRLPYPWTHRFVSLGVVLGITHMALPYVLVYWAEQHISSGLTAVLYATMPFVVAVMARLIVGDALTMRKLGGIALGVTGVWFIYADSVRLGGSQSVLGIGAVLLSVFFAALSTVLLKRFGKEFNALVMLVLPFWVGGTLVLAAGAPVEKSNPLTYDAQTWGTILYLAILGSGVAFTLLFWVIQRVDVTVVAYQTFIIPVLALFFGWVFLDETVTSRLALGSALILAGIAVATLRRTATRRARIVATPVSK